MTIGQQIANRRQSLSLTQRQVAAKLDVTVNFVSLIENGRRGMTLDVMERMAKALGCTWKLEPMGK